MSSLSVQLELPEIEAEKLGVALLRVAEAEGWDATVTIDGSALCQVCGRRMVTWSTELGIHVCVHIEDHLSGG